MGRSVWHASGSKPTVTLPLGTSTITLAVNDGRRTSPTDSVAVQVTIRPEGFQPPLSSLVLQGQSAPLPERAFRAGSVLPLKLQLFCGSTSMGNTAVAAPQIVGLLRTGEPINLETTDVDAGKANDSGLAFRFTDESWVYNFGTGNLTAGSYVITIQLPDGRRFSGAFDLR